MFTLSHIHTSIPSHGGGGVVLIVLSCVSCVELRKLCELQWSSQSDYSLLLPGGLNKLQIQCKVDFNTLLLRKPHSRCINRLWTMSVVHVGWLLGTPGHHRWFLVLTCNIWWFWMIFGVFFTTLSLNNALFHVILCYL